MTLHAALTALVSEGYLVQSSEGWLRILGPLPYPEDAGDFGPDSWPTPRRRNATRVYRWSQRPSRPTGYRRTL